MKHVKIGMETDHTYIYKFRMQKCEECTQKFCVFQYELHL